jgi:hypothetical protein
MAKKIQIETLEELLKRIGDDAMVAAWIGIGRSGVSEIKRRKPGNLAPRYWLKFVKGAQAAGFDEVDFTYLALIHAYEHGTVPEK